MTARRLLLLTLTCSTVLALAAGQAPLPEYRVQKTYALGGDGGWDYIALDESGRRLFIARATRVMVVDPTSGKLISEIPDIDGAHGVALVPEFNRGFATAGRDNSVTMFDLQSLKTVGKAQTAAGPDAIIYDPASKRVFSFNGRGRSTTVINPADGKVVATVALDGRPEFAVADGKGHVYVDIEDTSELATIDSQKMMVTTRWPLAPCEQPAALAMDTAHRRLFVGCRNRKLAIVNADSGKVISTLPIGEGVDAAGFDPQNQLVFASNWDGTLTVVHEDTPDQYSPVTNVQTALGARTMTLDPSTHTLYLVTAKYQDAEPGKDRRATVPNTFELLVVAPGH